MNRNAYRHQPTLTLVRGEETDRRQGRCQLLLGPNRRHKNLTTRDTPSNKTPPDNNQTAISGRLMTNAITESAQSASPETISLTAIFACRSGRQRIPATAASASARSEISRDDRSICAVRNFISPWSCSILPRTSLSFSVTSSVSLIVVARFRICRYCVSSASAFRRRASRSRGSPRSGRLRSVD